jgi:hypothetical protein
MVPPLNSDGPKAADNIQPTIAHNRQIPACLAAQELSISTFKTLDDQAQKPNEH